jgi:flavin-dependent dehydrogenase
VKRPLIIGGGLAGPAAAIRLARGGHPPVLLERQAGAHDKICGEFLSVEAVGMLAALGVDTGRLGALPIDRVRLAAGRWAIERRLPFTAHSVRRRTLDAVLLDEAERSGATVHRGVHAQRLVEGGVETDHGVMTEGAVVLATGKHPMSGTPRRQAPGIPLVDDLVGFKQYRRATPALARRLTRTVLVVAYDGGYAGVQLVAPDVVNLCLVLAKPHVRACGGRWDRISDRLAREPALAPVFNGEPLMERPLTISGVPYGFLAEPHRDDAVYRLGDQAAVIPSFCGDGMAIAIHSGCLLADALHQGASPAEYHARLRLATVPPVHTAMRIQRVVRSMPGRLALLAGFAAIPGAVRVLARATRVAPPPA